jgi:hypothetical protein
MPAKKQPGSSRLFAAMPQRQKSLKTSVSRFPKFVSLIADFGPVTSAEWIDIRCSPEHKLGKANVKS